MAHYSVHYRWAVIFLGGPLSFWPVIGISQEASVPKLVDGEAVPSLWATVALPCSR